MTGDHNAGDANKAWDLTQKIGFELPVRDANVRILQGCPSLGRRTEALGLNRKVSI